MFLNCKLIVKLTAQAETKIKITVGYENNDKKQDSVYSKRIKAGKRRTYFFDVKATRGNDFYLTITESRKRFNEDSYERHKIFLYKEDFNKFVKGLSDAVDYVKTELMPDFDFDAFNHDTPYEGEEGQQQVSSVEDPNFEKPVDSVDEIVSEEILPATVESKVQLDNGSHEEVDKW